MIPAKMTDVCHCSYSGVQPLYPEMIAQLLALSCSAHYVEYFGRADAVLLEPSVPSEGSIEEPLIVLAELKRQGLIRHFGLNNVTPRQFAEAQKISDIVCVEAATLARAALVSPAWMLRLRRARRTAARLMLRTGRIARKPYPAIQARR
jgi:Aldo/keto reductase family